MKHSEIKNIIIETASSLFYDKGYNSTGINEIISESGIAKATLYNHFKSKDEICLAYLQFMNNSFMKNIGEFAFSQPKGKTQILAIFDFLDMFFQTNDFKGCWCVKTISEIPNDNKIIITEIQNQKNALINLISKLISSNLNEIRTEELISLSRKIYLLYESAVSESYLHQTNWPIKETKDLCSKILI